MTLHLPNMRINSIQQTTYSPCLRWICSKRTSLKRRFASSGEKLELHTGSLLVHAAPPTAIALLNASGRGTPRVHSYRVAAATASPAPMGLMASTGAGVSLPQRRRVHARRDGVEAAEEQTASRHCSRERDARITELLQSARRVRTRKRVERARYSGRLIAELPSGKRHRMLAIGRYGTRGRVVDEILFCFYLKTTVGASDNGKAPKSGLKEKH